MTQDERERAAARAKKAIRNAEDAKTGKLERDAQSKAVIDNRARLRALRLAREAAEPPAPPKAPKKVAAKKTATKKKAAPALSEWLDGEQSGGRRT